MTNRRFVPQWFRCGMLIALIQAAAVGQSQTASRPAAAPVAKGTLSLPKVYTDGSFGFSIPYLEGAEFEREKRFVSPSVLEIVRFVELTNAWSLAVHLVTEDRPASPADMLETTAARLAKELAEFNGLRSEPATIDSRDGARLACSFKSENMEWLRQQAFIRKSTNEYYALILITPLTDRPIAEKTFDQVVDSFKILRSELEQQRIDAALKLGTEFKLAVSHEPARLQGLDKKDTYLRYLENGREIGFRHTLQTRREREHRPGIMIQEWGWMFREDKSIAQIQQAMFVSNDLSYAEWDNRSRVFVPPDEKGKPLSFFGIEMGLLKDNMLLMNYTPLFNADSLKEKAIAVEPSFGPPAWFAVLPQLLDLKKTELYAFSAYDSDRRGLVLRTYEVVGPTTIIIDGRQLQAFRIRDSEGLLPPLNEIDVDATGKILRAAAGPIELVGTTEAYIQKTYKDRVEAAMKTLEKNPVKPPALPRPESNAPPQENGQPASRPGPKVRVSAPLP